MTKPKTIPWANYKLRSLEITRTTKPPFDQWEDLVAGMDVQIEASPFWRGDAYNIGESWYGADKATSIFDPVSGTLKTWQNNASICARIEVSRRRESLSYSHHADVAYLKPEDFAEKNPELAEKTPEALQDYFLDLAIENLLSVTQLRAKIKFDKGETDADPLDDPISFKKGSVPTRIEKTRDRVQRIIDDADDTQVLQHLNLAYRQLQLAFEATQKTQKTLEFVPTPEPDPVPADTLA